jgi:hypothetical protein
VVAWGIQKHLLRGKHHSTPSFKENDGSLKRFDL